MLPLFLLAAFGCGDAHDAESSPEREASDSGSPDAGEPDAGELDPAERPCVLERQAWGLEHEELIVSLACETGFVVDADAIELENVPDGATFDRDSLELRWTPALDQAGTYTIRVRLPERERGTIRIGVADRFEHQDNVPIADPIIHTEEFGLPVIHLGVSPDINDDAHTPATFVYRGRVYEGVQAKFRGSTSASYPKRSFTIKFDKDARFVDEARGFPGARRIVLSTTFDDNSYVRQRLAFELWNRMAPEHVQVHHFNAVVYVDNEYQGLYEVTDHINDDFLHGLGMPAKLNVYKARKRGANFRLTDSADELKKSITFGYSKEGGLPEAGTPGANADLEAMLNWIANTTEDSFVEGWEERLSRRSFEDWMVFTSLIGATDGTTKNYYLVHDAREDAPDTRWRVVPWDFNVSFGQNYQTEHRGFDNYPLDYFAKTNLVFERLLRVPRLREPALQRYREVLNDHWAIDEVLAMLDGWARENQRSAERDEVRWREEFLAYWAVRPSITTSAEEIEYLRGWLADRWRFMSSQL